MNKLTITKLVQAPIVNNSHFLIKGKLRAFVCSNFTRCWDYQEILIAIKNIVDWEQ